MQGTSLQNFNQFGQVVLGEKLFKDIVDAQTNKPLTIDKGQSHKLTLRT